jgi:hypothetical protein
MNRLKNNWHFQKVKHLYIGVAAVLFFVADAKSQSAPLETDRPVSDEVVLENEMSNENLSAAQLQSFNKRATQKLVDFADVLTILENEEIGKRLKKEVAEAALDFFESEEVEIQWYDLEVRKITTENLRMFLEKIVSDPSGSEIKIVDISGGAPSECTPPICGWKLNCRIIQVPENEKAVAFGATVSIVLVKKEKDFGGVKKEIWEVVLGKIENIYLSP